MSKLILLIVIAIFGGLFSLGGLRITYRSIMRLIRSRQRRQGRLLLRREAFTGLFLTLAGIAVAVVAIKLVL